MKNKILLLSMVMLGVGTINGYATTDDESDQNLACACAPSTSPQVQDHPGIQAGLNAIVLKDEDNLPGSSARARDGVKIQELEEQNQTFVKLNSSLKELEEKKSQHQNTIDEKRKEIREKENSISEVRKKQTEDETHYVKEQQARADSVDKKFSGKGREYLSLMKDLINLLKRPSSSVTIEKTKEKLEVLESSMKENKEISRIKKLGEKILKLSSEPNQKIQSLEKDISTQNSQIATTEQEIETLNNQIAAKEQEIKTHPAFARKQRIQNSALPSK